MPHICADEVIAFMATIAFIGPLVTSLRARWRAWHRRYKCENPRCPNYSHLGVRLTSRDVHKQSDDLLHCNACASFVRDTSCCEGKHADHEESRKK